MPALKTINLNGNLLEITDSTARANAESATDLANNAQDTANTALSTANSKALITYNESEMTMYIK